LCFFDIYAQTVDETIKNADKLYEFGDFNKSISLYRRALFFYDENPSEILSKIGDCYFGLSDFTLAEEYYDSAFSKCTNNKKNSDLVYKKLDCNIFFKEFKRGIDVLNSSDEVFVENPVKANFYKGLLLFGDQNYKSSQIYFLKILCDTCDDAKDSLLDLFNSNFKYPNPEIAGVLSSVLPGSGQLYSGNHKDALNSFLLVGAIMLICSDMYFSFGLIDPIVSISPWLKRYYEGGIENAINSAEIKRNLRRNDILNRILSIIRHNIKE